MKTYKIIQLMAAGALALGLNGVAVAGAISLGTTVSYTNSTDNTKEFVDYFSFSLGSLSNVIFNYTDSGLLSQSTLSIFSDHARTGPNPIRKDTQIGSVASITGGSGLLATTSIAAGHYYLLVDAFLPNAMHMEHSEHSEHTEYRHEETHTPATGNFALTGYRATPVTPVPEPNVYALMLAGVGLVGFMSYRRQRYFS